MANEKDIQIQQRLNQLLKEKAGLVQKVADAEAKQAAKAGEYITKTEKSMKLAQQRADLAEKIFEFEEMSEKAQKNHLKAEAKRVADLKARNQLSKEEAALLEEINAIKTEIAANEGEITAEMQAQLQAAIDLRDAKQENREEVEKETEALLQNLDTLGGMVGLTSTQTTLFGKMGKSVKSIAGMLSNSEGDLEMAWTQPVVLK